MEDLVQSMKTSFGRAALQPVSGWGGEEYNNSMNTITTKPKPTGLAALTVKNAVPKNKQSTSLPTTTTTIAQPFWRSLSKAPNRKGPGGKGGKRKTRKQRKTRKNRS